MPHWKEFDPNEGSYTNLCTQVKSRLWYWIEQTRGEKTKAQFIREILTEVMENDKARQPW